MERRELLKMIALATGSVVIGGEFLLSGCKNNEAGKGITFSQEDIDFLNEVAETILPKTNTPGAKDAKVGDYMKVMVNDCYTEKDQKAFYAGIKQLDEACNKMHQTNFMKASPEQRKALLIELDKEAKAFQKEKGEKEKAEKEKAGKERNKVFEFEPNHYFTMMKQLTLSGFFTSEVGAKQALRYVAVPGKFDGCIDYKKGDKAWATS
ncbi:MAG: gluconate 2-dehydrogenase subunit 3 family protein [Sphingobacteriia bacterium]|nr:gluconate 2-dehydrogenase subunit 3 family protein [Sphingobacteriia bacterium]